MRAIVGSLIFGVMLIATHAAAQTPAAATAGRNLPAPSTVVPQYGTQTHLGVASCAGSTCHGAVQPFRGSNVLQNEYVTWTRRDPHAKAYRVLLEERSIRMARNLGLPNAHTAAVCLDCHADNVPRERQGRQFQMSDGVGCEACHGGSSTWLGIHISGGTHQQNLQAGLYATEDPVARAKLCLGCHFGDEKKFVTHRIMGAGHPRMSFELDTFTAIQPAHYLVDKDYVERKGSVNGVQTWAIGQALALGQIMDAFLDPKRNVDGIFPELVFFDCHACHHPMSDIRWQSRSSTGLGPGLVRFNDSNALMLQLIAERTDPDAGRELKDRMLAFHAATQRSREQALAEARAIKGLTDRLVQRFAGRAFGRDDVRALMQGVLARARDNQFTDYAGAEQSTMALSALISAMRNIGMVNDAQFTALNGLLDKAYETVKNDEAYKPAAFVEAMQQFQAAIPGNN
jgi:hypothetical protein